MIFFPTSHTTTTLHAHLRMSRSQHTRRSGSRRKRRQPNVFVVDRRGKRVSPTHWNRQFPIQNLARSMNKAYAHPQANLLSRFDAVADPRMKRRSRRASRRLSNARYIR